MISLTRAVEAATAAQRKAQSRSRGSATSTNTNTAATSTPTGTAPSSTPTLSQTHARGSSSVSVSSPDDSRRQGGRRPHLQNTGSATSPSRTGNHPTAPDPSPEPIQLPGRVSTYHTTYPQFQCVHCHRLLLGDSRWVTRLLRKARNRERKKKQRNDLTEEEEEERTQMAVAARFYPERVARGRDSVVWPRDCGCRFHWECLVRNISSEGKCPSCQANMIQITTEQPSRGHGTNSVPEELDAQMLCGMTSPDIDEQHPRPNTPTANSESRFLVIDILPYVAAQFGFLDSCISTSTGGDLVSSLASLSPPPHLSSGTFSTSPWVIKQPNLLAELSVKFLTTCRVGNVVDVADQIQFMAHDPDLSPYLPHVFRAQALFLDKDQAVALEQEADQDAVNLETEKVFTSRQQIPGSGTDTAAAFPLSSSLGNAGLSVPTTVLIQANQNSTSEERVRRSLGHSPGLESSSFTNTGPGILKSANYHHHRKGTPSSHIIGFNIELHAQERNKLMKQIPQLPSSGDLSSGTRKQLHELDAIHADDGHYQNTSSNSDRTRVGGAKPKRGTVPDREATPTKATIIATVSELTPDQLSVPLKPDDGVLVAADGDGQSALHLAVRRQQEDVVWLLLLMTSNLPVHDIPDRVIALMRERFVPIPPRDLTVSAPGLRAQDVHNRHQGGHNHGQGSSRWQSQGQAQAPSRGGFLPNFDLSGLGLGLGGGGGSSNGNGTGTGTGLGSNSAMKKGQSQQQSKQRRKHLQGDSLPDIRVLKDQNGMTAEQVALKIGGVWDAWVWDRLLSSRMC